jgi:hypothetical protein
MSVQSTGLSDDERLVVSPRRAWHMLGCGNTHGYALIKAGELETYLDGKSRKITVASIHALIARRLAAAGTMAAHAEPTRGRPRKPAGPMGNNNIKVGTNTKEAPDAKVAPNTELVAYNNGVTS